MANYCSICGKTLGFLDEKVTLANGIICAGCKANAGLFGDNNINSYSVSQVKEWINDPHKYEDFIKTKKAQAEEAKKAVQQEKKARIAASTREDLIKQGIYPDVSEFEEINTKINEALIEIWAAQKKSKIWSFGSPLIDDAVQNFNIQANKTLVEQNKILMRQNAQIIALLRDIADKIK